MSWCLSFITLSVEMLNIWILSVEREGRKCSSFVFSLPSCLNPDTSKASKSLKVAVCCFVHIANNFGLALRSV